MPFSEVMLIILTIIATIALAFAVMFSITLGIVLVIDSIWTGIKRFREKKFRCQTEGEEGR